MTSRLISLLASVAAVFAYQFSAVASAETAILAGPDKFVFTDCSNANFILRFFAATAPILVRSTNISTNDSSKSPVAWSISWDKPVQSDPAASAYQSTGTLVLRGPCPAAGTYDVPLTVVLSGADNTKPTTTTALDIQLVRTVEAQLDVPASLILPIAVWPFGLGYADQLPHVRLVETSHGSPLTGVSATGGELTNPAGDVSEISVEPKEGALRIEPGGSANLELNFSAIPQPGPYISHVIVHAPSLAKPDQTVAITFKVRESHGFLLCLIAFGVGLGWWFNVWLANRTALNAAKFEALRSVGLLTARASAQPDPAVQQRLVSVAAALESAIRSGDSPATVQQSVATALKDADAIEAAARSASAACEQDLARIRGLFMPANQPLDDAVADLLSAIRSRFDLIDVREKAGDTEAAQNVLAAFEQEFPRAVGGLLRPWLSSLNAALDELGPWASPAQELEQKRQALQADIQTAYLLADTGQLIQHSDAIARSLRGMVVFDAPRTMAMEFHAAAATLTKGGLNDFADAIRMEAENASSTAAIAASPLLLLNRLCAIRRGVEKQIRASASQGGVNVDALLAQGDFLAAAAAAAAAPPAAPAAGGAAVAHGVPVFDLPRPKNSLPATPATAIVPRLILPPQIKQKDPSPIKLEWASEAPDGHAVDWSCSPGGNGQLSNTTSTGVDVTPVDAGFFTVTVTIDGSSPISATTYVGSVIVAPGTKIIEKRVRWDNVTVACVTAVVTAFAGYEIFANSWYGTWSDWFAAFVWGFFGQFGLDRVRDIVRPITSRTAS